MATIRTIMENMAACPSYERILDADDGLAFHSNELCKTALAMEAIVDKLPRTADGVPVVPGMRLYGIGECDDVGKGRGDVLRVTVGNMALRTDKVTYARQLRNATLVGLYSTREAATEAEATAAHEAAETADD